MSFSTELTTIKARFATWTATRIKWENTAFSEPTVPWIAVFVLDGEAEEATIGPLTQRRHIGVVSIQIFDKQNAGDVNIRVLADAVEALFIGANSRITISATEWIDFMPPALTPGQFLNGWQQRNVTVPFQRNEIK